jgi:fermentation-respiration switch protein FrsA (DUF1100 family)
MSKLLRRHWLLPAFAAVVVILAMSGILERMFVYFPAKAVHGSPSDLRLAYEDLTFVTDDGLPLHGWYVRHPSARCTFIAFHGNAGNIGDRLPWIELLYAVPGNVLIFDYRGYGRSAGRPHEQGLYRDAGAVYRWWAAQRDRAPARVVLIGESLGGAVAADLATRERVDGIILQSTFTSAWDMAKTMLPIGVLQPLTGVRFDSIQKLRDLPCPKLIIHGDRDDIVPFRLGEKLFAAAAGPKYFYRVQGAAHNDLLWVAGGEYTRRIRQFVDSIE